MLKYEYDILGHHLKKDNRRPDNTDILVIGYYTPGGVGGGAGSGTGYGTSDTNPNSGDSSPPPPEDTPASVLSLTRNCTSKRGAARMIAEALMFGVNPATNNPPKVGPYDWHNIEFATFVVRNGTQYSASNNMLYSNGLPNMALLPKISDVSGFIEGISHNHPANGAEPNTRQTDRYPSLIIDQNGQESGDWVGLQALKDRVAQNDASYDPSLWITDSVGVTREFRLSDRQIFRSLSQNQMIAGEGLAGRTVNDQCGDIE